MECVERHPNKGREQEELIPIVLIRVALVLQSTSSALVTPRNETLQRALPRVYEYLGPAHLDSGSPITQYEFVDPVLRLCCLDTECRCKV